MTRRARPRTLAPTILVVTTVLTTVLATVVAGAQRAEALTYQQLVALLARHPSTGAPVDSTAELLSLLPDELRANFTLVHASRGPHRDVDPLHPRAILFRRDARLLLAFTDTPGGASRDVLEIIHFRDEDRAFELHRIVLPAAARRDPALAAQARANHVANPASCARCHGADPRPITDSYFLWPGFYGSVQDRFLPGGAELRDYRRFLARLDGGDGGVYRLLTWPTGTPVPPYFLDPSLVESSRIDLAPNTRLGIALTELNRKRIARKIEASPRYPALRDKLLAGLLGCAPLPVSGADRRRIEHALVVEDRAKLERQGVPRADRAERAMAELTSATNLAEIDFLARALDVSRADWSMALEPGALAFYDGILSGEASDGADFYFKEDLLVELLRPLLREGFTSPFYDDQPFGERLDLERARRACSPLAESSRAVPWPDVPPAAPPVVARCVSCHQPGGDGPLIPFDSPARLRALLDERPDLLRVVAQRIAPRAERPMPAGGPHLDAGDRRALLGYLRAL